MAHLDGLPADLDGAAAPVGQVDGAGRNLCGKPQRVCRPSARILEAAACFAREGGGDLIRVGRDRAEHGVEARASGVYDPNAPSEGCALRHGRTALTGIVGLLVGLSLGIVTHVLEAGTLARHKKRQLNYFQIVWRFW